MYDLEIELPEQRSQERTRDLTIYINYFSFYNQFIIYQEKIDVFLKIDHEISPNGKGLPKAVGLRYEISEQSAISVVAICLKKRTKKYKIQNKFILMRGTYGAQRERAWRQYGYLKNFGLPHIMLLDKDKQMITFSKAHISPNPCCAFVQFWLNWLGQVLMTKE